MQIFLFQLPLSSTAMTVSIASSCPFVHQYPVRDKSAPPSMKALRLLRSFNESKAQISVSNGYGEKLQSVYQEMLARDGNGIFLIVFCIER